MNNIVNKYLKKEYADNFVIPVVVKINGESVIVPYSYAKDGVMGQDRFYADYFNHFDDVNLPEIAKYTQNNLEPKFVEIDNLEFPIPFHQRNVSPYDVREDLISEFSDKYEYAILLGMQVNKYRKNKQSVKIGFDEIESLEKIRDEIKSYKEKFAKKENPDELEQSKPSSKQSVVTPQNLSPEDDDYDYVKEKILKLRNKVLTYGIVAASLVGGAVIVSDGDDESVKPKIENDSTSLKKKGSDAKFQRLLTKIFEEEGGYATKGQIDQETNFGIINTTYSAFKKQYPTDAKNMPKKLIDLKKNDASTIIKKAFFEHYRIDEVKNESVSCMLLDICYNHTTKTRNGFAKSGVDAVFENHGDLDMQKPQGWSQTINFINECDDDKLECFYNEVAESRVDFMEDGRVDKFVGLITRAKKYLNKFVPENEPSTKNISVFDLVKNKLAKVMD